MPTDFAAKVRKPNKKQKKGTPNRNGAHRNKRGPSFHGPSFSAGAILGVIIVFLMAYAPEFIINNSTAPAKIENSIVKEAEPEIEITFPTILKESQVRTDTSKYQVAPKITANNSLSGDFLYQTASFRDLADAEKLRAKLLLNNLKANIKIKTLNEVEWHRVQVGPFDNKNSAEKARLKLSELSIPAIRVNTSN